MRDEDWFILLTGTQDTLPLCRTLNDDGFEAWVPAFMERLPFPRHKLKPEGVKKALMPGFVFVRAPHLMDLLDLSRSGKPHRHRDFRVFSRRGDIHMIPDSELDGLRTKEVEAVPKKARPTFLRGRSVRVTSGPFQGLIGKVEWCKSGFAKITIGAWPHPVEISTFLLSEEEVSSPPKDERAPRHRNAVKYLRRAA